MAEPELPAVGQIAIPVTDLDRAVTFYRDTLGLRLTMRFSGLAFFDCAGVRLMLSKPEGSERHSSTLYFRVRNLEKSYERFRSRGVAFTDAPHRIFDEEGYELRMAFFRDPDGNVLALMAEVPKS